MRLLRLLVFLVVGLVTATSASSHQPPPKLHHQAYNLAHQSLRQFQAGNHAAALRDLQSAQRLMLSKPDAFSAHERQGVGTLLKQLGGKQAASSTTSAPLQGYRHTLMALDPLRHVDAFPKSHDQPRRNWQPLQSLWKAIPRPAIVRADVRQFGQAFRAGARAPLDALFEEKYLAHANEVDSTHSKPQYDVHFSETNAGLVDSWLQIPKERRIFVIGARSDAAYVALLRERTTGSGLHFFFYQDCNPLCQEATVGGFMATSGRVISIESADAKKSRFVAVEPALSHETRGSGRRIILIDGEVATQLLTGGSAFTGAATLLACGVVQQLTDDSLCGDR